jgi:hypothetical protein
LKKDSSINGEYRLLLGDLSDFGCRFLDTQDGGLRLPGKSVAPNAQEELPFTANY